MIDDLREGTLLSNEIREKIEKLQSDLNNNQEKLDLNLSKNFMEKDLLQKTKRKINQDIERLST